MTNEERTKIETALQKDLEEFTRIHETDPHRAARYDLLASEMIYLIQKYEEPAELFMQVARIAFTRGTRYAHACDKAKRKEQAKRGKGQAEA